MDELQQYTRYADIKKKYQLGEVSEKALEMQMRRLCRDISDFITAIYYSTELPIERDYMRNMIEGLQTL